MNDIVVTKFDDRSKNWSKDRDLNTFLLHNVLDYMADSLKSRGHLFLNEVFDELGLPRTSQGQLVGWLYVDKPGVRYWEILTSSEVDDIVLKFYTQGDIHDKIEDKS